MTTAWSAELPGPPGLGKLLQALLSRGDGRDSHLYTWVTSILQNRGNRSVHPDNMKSLPPNPGRSSKECILYSCDHCLAAIKTG